MKIYPYYREKQSEKDINDNKHNNEKKEFLNPKRSNLFGIGAIFIYLAAFLLSRSMIWEELFPFGTAFCSAALFLMPEKAILIIIAAILGAYTCLQGQAFFAATVTLIMIFVFHVFASKINYRYKNFFVPMISFISIVIVKTVFLAFYDADLYDYLSVMFEAGFSAVLTLVYLFALPVIIRWHSQLKDKEGKNLCLTGEELFCLLVLTGSLLAGIGDISWKSLYLVGIINKLIIMTAAWIGGGGIGAAAGVTVALIPSFSQINSPSLVGVYALAGLLSGVLGHFGKLMVAVGFLLGSILMTFYLEQYQQITGMLMETAIALVFFIMLPKKLKTEARRVIHFLQPDNSKRQIIDNRIQELVNQRLNNCAVVFSELAQSFEHAAGEMPQKQRNEYYQDMIMDLAGKICTDCCLNRICWENDLQNTSSGLADTIEFAVQKGDISIHELPDIIKKRCGKLKELALTINLQVHNYNNQKYWQERVLESRSMLSSQLQGMSDLALRIASEVGFDIEREENLASVISAELTRMGITLTDISVIGKGEKAGYEIGIVKQACNGKQECTRVIVPVISQVLGKKVSVMHSGCCCYEGQNQCSLKICPSLKLKLKIATAMAAKDVSGISGDSCSAVELIEGKYALILSDGMGCGKKAFEESNTARSLLEKLLSIGFEQKFAVKMVNSLLIMRSPEETFTTLDLAVVDLYNCCADFLKVAAAPSYLLRNGRVDIIRAEALPLGVISELEISVINKRLKKEDVLIIVSDGVADSGKTYIDQELWIANALEKCKETDPQKIAGNLLWHAQKNYGGMIKDDLTIMAAIIEEVN